MMRLLCHFSIITAILAAALLRPADGVRADTTARLRVGVTADGITRITPADLSVAGVNPADVNPATLALSSLGQAVAIQVIGGEDGDFVDAGDSIRFFGEKFRGAEMDEKYTDERVYWLDIGGAAGPRITEVSAAPFGDLTPPADFPTTVRAEQNLTWWTQYTTAPETQDTWFWERIRTTATLGASITRPFTSTITYPAPGFPATLRLQELSRDNSYYSNYYHHTKVVLNGSELGAFDWVGKATKVFTMTVPAGLMASGANTLTVGVHNTQTTVSDDIYVNYWEADYRRLFRAVQGKLDFSSEAAGTHEYLADGWPAAAVEIWEVSDPVQPRRLTGAAVQSGGANYSVRFRVDEAAGSRYWMQDATTVGGPASIRLRPPTDLRNPAGGADAVLVTHANLRPAAEALAQWHTNHGRRALVVDAADVYDEFNDGIYHPKAIQALMSWASAHWIPPAPAYLTLVGGGHWNFKSYGAYGGAPIMIPPYLAWVDPWQGEVPADAYFGDLTGDGVPEISVGRLAVNTLEEALTVVSKTVEYNEDERTDGWEHQALFVSDGYEIGNDFPAVSDEIADHYVPADITVQKAYLWANADHPGTPNCPNVTTCKNAIRSSINAGVWMVQYTGHGSVNRWNKESPYLWTPTDIATLTNGTMVPLVMTFNCLDGYFAYPNTPSIADSMQRQLGGGSVAAISPSGLGVTSDQLEFRKLLMEAIFWDEIREVGKALTVAKQRFHARFGANYLLHTEMLFGDPAMRLPRADAAFPKAPEAAIERSGSHAVLSWPAVTHDVFDNPTTITGYRIWRGNQPYFDPNQPNCNCALVGSTAGLTWTDTGSFGPITPVGDVSHNYFYVVQAANSAGHSSLTRRIGEFDFALVPGQ